MASSFDHHSAALQKALDRIESGLCHPIDLRELAALSGMSFWHFQHTFTQLMGESVASYIRRRRLTEVARAMRQSSSSLLDLALHYQFQSHAAFTRAFKSVFGVRPSEYRKHPRALRASRSRVNPAQLRHFSNISTEPKWLDRPELRLVGLTAPYRGVTAQHPNDNEVINALWSRFFLRRHELRTPSSEGRYGAWTFLRPGICDEPEQYLAFAGVQAEAAGVPPSGMEVWIARAGTYAQFTHRGPVELLGNTISYIYTSWLPRATVRRGDGFDYIGFEHRIAGELEKDEIYYYLPLQN